jgi:formylglycine-generating enzyme
MKYVCALILAGLLPLSARAVTIDLVTIGNPGNPADINGGIFGSVASVFRIAANEVTNAQYVEFLNAKAATDTLELYSTSMNTFPQGGIMRSGVSGSYTYAVKPDVMNVEPNFTTYTYGNKPVVFVSWYDAIRFANWMHNGQGTGSTETGAYTILGGTPTPTNPDAIVRNGGAQWFLPTENQWYKAAYYNGTSSAYFDYPTGTNNAPDNQLPAADTGNSANYFGANFTTANSDYPMTPVGAYSQSDSPYGTFDQGGNVAEWNETLASTNRRVRRGGSWSQMVSALSGATRETPLALTENSSTGFRLAAPPPIVPVPGDYNSNGIVDGADYVVWRNHFGATFQLPNEVAGTSPGTVAQDDYTAWRARFGNTSGAGATSGMPGSAVPEPGACTLLLVALLVGNPVWRSILARRASKGIEPRLSDA